jgi:MATE family multidrug resistance protein
MLIWPIAIGQLANTGTSFVDAVMAGHIGANDLAAVSLGSSIWIALVITLIGLLLSVAPVIAQLYGAQRLADIPNIVQQGIWLALVLSIMAFFLASAIVPIFQHLGLTRPVQEKATHFLLAIRWGFPAVAVFRILYGYSACLNQTKPLMLVSIFILLLNIPINYILIHGLFGFPALGGVGCGWATAFCMWVSVLILGWWINRAEPYRATHPFKHFYPPQLTELYKLLKIGSPIGLMFFIEISAFSLVALMIANLGALQVAGHQITINFSALVFMIPQSIGTALTVRVGYALGANDPVRARFISWVGIGCGLVTATLTASIVMIFSEHVAAIYTTDVALRALAAHLLIYAGIFQFSDATQVCAAGALRGYKKTRNPMLIYMFAFWVVALPLGFVLAQAPAAVPFAPRQPWGAEGFWLAVVLGLTLAAGALVWLLHRVSQLHITEQKKALSQ